jgi:hypothetical protein
MSDHKLISWLKEYSGSQTEDEIKQRFVHMSDQQRVADLQNISTWLDDSSSNLRQKSQIMRLGRDLDRIHRTLRAVGK